MSINAGSEISNATLLLRSILASGITDPILSRRGSDSRFILTAYPEKVTEYPHISIINENLATKRLGMASEKSVVKLPFEIRVWARNQSEKDKLTEQTLYVLRTKQWDSGNGTVEQGLYGFDVDNAVNIDEKGKLGVKSKVITVNYLAVTN